MNGRRTRYTPGKRQRYRMTEDRLWKELEQKFNLKVVGPASDWYSDPGLPGLIVSAEDSFDGDVQVHLDYYGEFGEPVSDDLYNFLQKAGYYVEWIDAGTVHIAED